MTNLVRALVSTAAAVCIVGLSAGVAPAFAQEMVSGRGTGPGVEAPAAVEAASVSGAGVVLGVQTSRDTPLVLPRTGGLGEAQLALGLAAGLGTTLAGLRLRAVSTRRGRHPEGARAARPTE